MSKNIARHKNSCSIKFYDIDLFLNELVFFVSTFQKNIHTFRSPY